MHQRIHLSIHAWIHSCSCVDSFDIWLLFPRIRSAFCLSNRFQPHFHFHFLRYRQRLFTEYSIISLTSCHSMTDHIRFSMISLASCPSLTHHIGYLLFSDIIGHLSFTDTLRLLFIDTICQLSFTDTPHPLFSDIICQLPRLSSSFSKFTTASLFQFSSHLSFCYIICQLSFTDTSSVVLYFLFLFVFSFHSCPFLLFSFF